jgi:hypothetical protein
MLLTESQAAEFAQVDRRTLRHLIVTGRLRAIDFGNGKRRCFRIDPEDIGRVAAATPLVTPPPLHRRRRRRVSSEAPMVSFLPSV